MLSKDKTLDRILEDLDAYMVSKGITKAMRDLNPVEDEQGNLIQKRITFWYKRGWRKCHLETGIGYSHGIDTTNHQV